MRTRSHCPDTASGLIRLAVVGGLLTALLFLAVAEASTSGDLPYRSPLGVAFSPDGRQLAASDRTADQIVFLDPATGRILHRVSVAEPGGLVWLRGSTHLLAAEGGTSAVAEIDGSSGRVLRRLRVGPRPSELALAPRRNLLLATCAALHSVSVVDLATGREKSRIPCPAEPFAIAVTPDERTAVVGNLIPVGPATAPDNAATLTLIDLATCTRAGEVRLPAGSTVVRGVAVSPDGKWAYAVHTVGRFNLPTTQLDRGWVNTNALSIVDLSQRQVYATVLLDQIQEGAADPWGVAIDRDGRTLWITLSGVRRVARIDLARLHGLLAGRPLRRGTLLKMSPEYDASAQNAWAAIRRDPAQRALLVNDLSALRIADLITTTPLPGDGPRGVALAPDGKQLAVAMYFSGTIQLVSADTGGLKATLSLGPGRAPDQARVGERMFHDATLCYQHWLSCATCHPDARADGLNWDLLNDGIGNPKNVRSLLQADMRAPMMSQGERANIPIAVTAGFRFIEFHEPQSAEVRAIIAFLASLKPQSSPYRLADGGLSARARRGAALFESGRAGCALCHRGPLHTDQHIHDVGTRNEVDTTSRFVTPTLIEVWRTAPYLHDGRAVTIEEMLTRYNPADRHGTTTHLTRQEIKDLAEYVLSL